MEKEKNEKRQYAHSQCRLRHPKRDIICVRHAHHYGVHLANTEKGLVYWGGNK